MLDYLDQALGEGTPHHTSKGLQYSYKCPFCDDWKDRMFVHIDKQVFYCHNCDSTGSLVAFLADYGHISYRDALKLYREYGNVQTILPQSIEEEVYARLIQIPDIEITKTTYSLPEEFIPIEDAHGIEGKKAMDYLRRRGVSLDNAERYSLGYCSEGQYANRIILPDFEDGELVYWQARTWEPQPKNKLLKKYYRKVLNPSLSEEEVDAGIVAIDKSEIISNIDLIREEGTAILCEGRFDSLTIGDLGGCLHGKVLSDDQFIKLVKNKKKIDQIFIMLDGDAFSYSLYAAERLFQHFNDVYICKLGEKDDPNQIGKRGVLKALNEAIKYTPLFKVKAQLKGWI